MVKFTKNQPTTGGPSSSIGIMRFFDSEAGGPKLSPEFVVALAIVFIVVVMVVKSLGIF